MYDTWNPAELNEAIKNASGSGSDLPDVQPTDAGKVLTVNSSGEWEAADLPSSGYNIGLNEALTNKKYLEKEIYVRVFGAGTHTTTQGVVLELMDLPEGIDKIFSCRLMIDNQNQVIFSADVPVWVNNGKINVVAPVSTSNSIFWCILEYTKPEPVPEAKKTTRKKTN